MPGQQKFICIGNLGNDVKIKAVSSSPLGILHVFVKEKWTTKGGINSERTQIFTCNLWGPRAIALEHLLKKGSLVYIEGRIVKRDYIAKDISEPTEHDVVDIDIINVLRVKDGLKYKEQDVSDGFNTEEVY